jgi:hypothetical protein
MRNCEARSYLLDVEQRLRGRQQELQHGYCLYLTMLLLSVAFFSFRSNRQDARMITIADESLMSGIVEMF